MSDEEREREETDQLLRGLLNEAVRKLRKHFSQIAIVATTDDGERYGGGHGVGVCLAALLRKEAEEIDEKDAEAEEVATRERRKKLGLDDDEEAVG